jgi:hypothetical protein
MSHGTPPSYELPPDVTVLSIHSMYSAPQVAMATVLGGPLAGAWLIALNFKRLNAPRKADAAIMVGLIAVAMIAAIGLVAPYRVMRLLVMLFGIVMAGLAELLQGAGYDRHVAVGGRHGVSLRAIGVGVVCFPIHLISVLGATTVHLLAACLTQ